MMNKATIDLIKKDPKVDGVYFYIINDLMPDSVLDIGMLLKRNGSVTRSAGGLSISWQMILDGVDVMPDLKAGVYSVIYNHITSLDDFISEVCSGHFEKRYDLIVAFDLCDFIDDKQAEIIIPSLLNNSESLLLDSSSFQKYTPYLASSHFKKIPYEEATSYLIY